MKKLLLIGAGVVAVTLCARQCARACQKLKVRAG